MHFPRHNECYSIWDIITIDFIEHLHPSLIFIERQELTSILTVGSHARQQGNDLG